MTLKWNWDNVIVPQLVWYSFQLLWGHQIEYKFVAGGFIGKTNLNIAKLVIVHGTAKEFGKVLLFLSGFYHKIQRV